MLSIKCVFVLHDITIHFAFFNRDCVVSPGKTELSVVSDSKNDDDQQSPRNDEKRFDQPDAEQTKQTSEDSKNKALIACDEDGEPTSNSAKEKQKDESVVLPLGDESTEWSVEKLNKEFRKFNIDLHPRVRNCLLFR